MADAWAKTLKGKPAVGAVAERSRRTSMRDVEMFSAMTGDMNPLHYDAALAERKGLVSEVLARDQLLPRALEIAGAIATKSVAITPYAKRAVQTADQVGLRDGLRIEHELTVEAFAKEDRMEGLRAFAEKREPNFKGR